MYKLLSRNFILSIGVLLFASCATPPNKVEPPLPEEQTFSIKVGIDKLADKLLKQLENNGVNNANLVYNTFIDANSGQTLEMSLDIKKLFLEKTEDFKGFKVLSFAPENLNKADYIIDGFIRLEQRNMGKDYRVYAAIINLKDKKSIANDKIWLNKQGLNTKPTQSSKDSPMYSIDLKTLIDAITSSVGQEIADEYFNFLSVDAGISEADKLSSLGKFAEALKICSRIEQSPDGKRGVTYRCLYANYFKSGNLVEAERQFAIWVPVAIKENKGSIPVKIAFEVGSDKLYQEPESLQHFEIWLRQMAFYLKGNEKKCAYVLGHASITRYDVGQKEKNCGLSKKRAISVKDRIQQVSSNVDWRLRAVGKGSDECIKCTVPDSEENIIDRRVEFKVVACDSDIWKLRQEKECLVE